MTAPTTDAVLSLSALQHRAESLSDQVVRWRRHLHANPEVAFHEHATAQYIHEVLSHLPGLQLSRPTATSVVARLVGPLPGRVIAVRADIDALPIEEENDVPYRSQVRGAMHACGHDGHTSIVLGLATLLAAHRDELPGEVRFVFQHAEELSPGGAEELVNTGVMDGVDEVIGLRCWASMPVGRSGMTAGPAMAAPYTFRCTITGQGGHAAMPHDTIDPIAIGAQVVTALQQVVSRQVDPLDPCVLSITQFIAGTAFNVIPNSAYLAGTVRTFDAELRRVVPQRMERLIKGITEGFGATCAFTYELGYRPVVNDPALTERLTQVVTRTFGDDALDVMRPSMGGEDFSAYLQRAPGVFAFVGAGNVSEGIVFPHHHPRFNIDERSLQIGLRYLAAATHELLTARSA